MKLIVTGPKFVLSYEYVPWYQHQKYVVGGRERMCNKNRTRSHLWRNSSKYYNSYIKIQIFPNLKILKFFMTLPVTN